LLLGCIQLVLRRLLRRLRLRLLLRLLRPLLAHAALSFFCALLHALQPDDLVRADQRKPQSTVRLAPQNNFLSRRTFRLIKLDDMLSTFAPRPRGSPKHPARATAPSDNINAPVKQITDWNPLCISLRLQLVFRVLLVV
jgi:hypothetical protein